VRLEDAVWLNPETLKFEVLANYSKALVLKVKGVNSQPPSPKSQSAKSIASSKAKRK
jgi:hypothetical protein